MIPPKKRAGRPPGPEGTQRRYTVMLSPVQVRRALTLGDTISQGINNALRELVPDAPPVAPASTTGNGFPGPDRRAGAE